MSLEKKVYGRLRQKLHRKKQIDEWVFQSPFDTAAGKIGGFTAKIYCVRGRGDRLTLSAWSPHFEDPIEDESIANLREKVERAFQLADMAKRNIKWEEWIEIQLEDDDAHYYDGEHGVQISIQWRKLLRGVHPETGKAYTIHGHNKVVMPFPLPKKSGEKDAHDITDQFRLRERDVDTMYSYIPATKANVAALKELGAVVVAARGRLVDLLTQDKVAATLASAGQLRLEAPK